MATVRPLSVILLLWTAVLAAWPDPQSQSSAPANVTIDGGAVRGLMSGGVIAWKGIPYVEGLGIDLDGLDGPVTLFEGTAREGVPHFPANVNIAAALSLAGIGFDGTRLLVVADPELRFNTHFIRIRSPSGSIDLRFENVPSPDNPRTAMLAGFSALAAFKEFNSPVRYGT